MKRFQYTLSLLKEYGRFSSVGWTLFLMVSVIVYGIIINDLRTILFGSLPLLLVWWDISDVYQYKERDSLKEKLFDKEDEVIMLQGKNRLLEEELEIRKKITGNHKDNPIKSNRIVSDCTFAVRMKGFIEEVRIADCASEEEKEYLLRCADRLLSWQTKTVRKNTEEYRYLERLGLMPSPSANAEEHAEESPKEENPKRRGSSKRKTKTAGNENKD